MDVRLLNVRVIASIILILCVTEQCVTNEVSDEQEEPTLKQNIRLPCTCAKGECSCCTGGLLEQFGQKGCLNITYQPDDFSFTAVFSMNGRVLYKNQISGKNPPPMCVRIPRIRAIKVCVKLTNVYFPGANMHACANIAASWDTFTLFETSFDCFRIGANGVAIVKPEEGGGIAASEEDEDDEDDIEDYDDNAR